MKSKLRSPSQERLTERDFIGAFSGRVTRSSPTGIWFTLDDYSRNLEFGPARYPTPAAYETDAAGDPEHSHVITRSGVTDPPKGTEVLAMFANADPGRPYIVALYGWPA